MDTSNHTLADLFAQLGLDNSEPDIKQFIQKRSGISGDIRLEDADFWSTSQARFLQDALAEDSDWAEVVDTLNSLLR